MRPKVIIHNSISLDGKFDGHQFDLDLHYGIAMGFKPDALLAGSNTVKNAMPEVPPPTPADLQPHIVDPDDIRPYWVVVDSTGILQDVLHFYRKMEYIREIIVLVSDATPGVYLDWLGERGYPIVRVGDGKVDLPGSLERLREEFGIETLVVDTGGVLASVFLEQGLVDELSLVVAPILVGGEHPSLLDALKIACHFDTSDAEGTVLEEESDATELSLKLLRCSSLEKGHVHLHYSILD
jgi:2,5-diamino-6-(ribosylamino)-4(3H)-pyrimidinone 5'-phosphate reductase